MERKLTFDNSDLFGFPAMLGATGGLIVMYLTTQYAPPAIQVGLLGVLLTTILSLLVAIAHQVRTNAIRNQRMLSVLRAPVNLATEP